MENWDEEKVSDKERTVGFLWRSAKNFRTLLEEKRRTVLWLTCVLILCQIIALVVPYFFKLIFDELPANLARRAVSQKLIFLLAGFFILQMAYVVLLRLVVKMRMIRAIIFFENYWPVLAQKKLLSLSPGFHERENTGKKISKIEKGCDKLVQLLIDLFWNFLPQSLYLVINLCFIFFLDWRLGMILTAPIIFSIIWISKVFAGFFSQWDAWETMREKSSGFLCQSLINIRTVQSFVQEAREFTLFSGVREEMRELDYRISRGIDGTFFWVNFLLTFAFAACVIFGIYLAFLGQVTVGTVIFVVATGSVSIQSVVGLVEQYNQILRKFVTVNRFKALLDEEPDIDNHGGALPSGSGEIVVDSIAFVYPNKEQPVLQDFSLTIRPREMVALVGKSGEGKTTLARLICRTYDVSDGKILLDGHDIRELDLYAFRRLFAIVQQDVEIFDGTLRENVIYPCENASPEQVEEAIRASYLQMLCENTERMPLGIETQVGERGVRLSGGERQRVGIARAYIALLNGARFLILDEATSNLDSEAERAIQEMINQLRERLNISIIVIAHRLSTIKLADTIYVINDGRVEERGDHQTLLQQNGLYSRLVELQKVGDLRE